VTTPRPSARFLFVAPMRSELAPLARALRLERTTMAGLEVSRGSVGGALAIALMGGIGTAAVTRTTERALDAFDAGHVVVVGIAGGVRPDLAIGTVVVPAAVIDRATGAEYRPAPLGDVAPAGKILTGDELITDPDQLAGLDGEGVVALDMETTAVAAICERHGIPWSVFRAISDRATDGLLDGSVAGLARPDGTPNLPAALRYIVSHPGRLPKLARLARDSGVAARAAAQTAARAARAAVGEA